MKSVISRRTVLAGLGASVSTLVLPVPARASAADMRVLRAAPSTANLIDGGPGSGARQTAVWAYDGTVPGPVLRARVGDQLRVRLENGLDQDTTVHWHGIRIDNAMDGVPGMTQEPVPPGGTFDYDFKLPHPGTYWYHPHARSSEQIARGLHGVLIVDEEAAPDVDHDLLLVIDDWRITDQGQIDTGSFGNLHDAAHGGRLGNWLTINGASKPEFAIGTAERVRLRLVNVANARMFELDAAPLGAVILAVDGHGLESARPASAPILLGPGQRADIVFDAPGEPGTVAFDDVSTDARVTAARFAVSAGTQTGPARPALDGLSLPRFAPQPDMETARNIPLRMEGGAMGGLATARLNGEDMSMRDIAQQGFAWAFNGEIGHMHARLFTARLGETIALDLINDTSWPHAMHVHGHHFKIVSRDDKPAPDPDFRDTVLVGARQRVQVAFVADNPGNWMLHCHMLEHQAAGMMTSFAVTS